MIGRVVLDVVNAPVAPLAWILGGMFVGMVLLEGGVLALFGMRPVGKAFTSSFLVNMAACGAGLVLYMVGAQMKISRDWLSLFVLVFATVVQGLVLAANPVNLRRGRAWLAALSMKSSSLVLGIVVSKIFDI